MADSGAIVVIGSGPAGAMAAHELVRQGCRVVLLESGVDLPAGVLVRLMGRNLYRTRGKRYMENRNLSADGDPGELTPEWWTTLSPGGLSNYWTGAVPRFAPEDFHEGERLHPRHRWPLTYADLIPYYEQVERLLCVGGEPEDVPNLPAGRLTHPRRLPSDWQQVAQCAARRGQGLTVLPLADGPSHLVARRSTAFNSYSNLITPLLRSGRLQVLLGAHALQIEYSGAHGRASAVVYHDRATNRAERLEAVAVVVACGALHSTKLLFDSACREFPEGLGNTEGVLGRYLHDHPRDWWTFELEKPLSRPVPPAYLTRLPYASSPPLQATSWTIGLTPSFQEKVKCLLSLKGHTFAAQVFGTMIPQDHNRVQPDAARKDEFGRPQLDLCIAYGEEVTRSMTAARDQLLSLLEEAGHRGALRRLPTKIVPGSSVHYGGTVRMHESPEYGMLDGWNRLHAIPNLLVVDASCFTTGPEKNPTLTAMALAARAADRLVHDLRRGENLAV